MNIMENEQWMYKITAVVFVPSAASLQVSDCVFLPACHRKLVLRSSSLHRQAESCFFLLYYHKKSCEKQRDSSVCSPDSTRALYCTPSASSGHFADVCGLCPLCCASLCQSVPPLHLCDELLPENENVSDLCSFPSLALSAC